MYRSTVLLLLLLLPFCRAARPKPYEASCPKRCRCSANVLDCRNAPLTKDDLETVRPEAFVELDTIDFFGAKLGDISDGIFPDGVVHPMVTQVNLTRSGITRISSKTFQQLPNVEFLDLSGNSIDYAGRSTFKEMKKLRKVDLTKTLRKRSTDASHADLLAEMFESRGRADDNLVELGDIVLDDNGLKFLHPSTFCKVRGLVRLQLADNELSSFDVQEGCLGNLKNLDISGNNFTTFTASFWDHLGGMTALDISGNPLNCTCSLQPFLKIARAEGEDFVNQGRTSCSGPDYLKGSLLFDIKDDLCQLETDNSSKSGYGFGTFFLLALVAGAVLLTYRHFRRRRRSEVPFEFGYSGLEADEDVQPEFV